ncbi:MAG: complement resistance protein TraT [Deltaproteobacteria bacterium]|nr:complement resistance protein TraT [Deltaproteobacteria bacterium]
MRFNLKKMGPAKDSPKSKIISDTEVANELHESCEAHISGARLSRQGFNGRRGWRNIKFKLASLILFFLLPVFAFTGCATTAGQATSASGLSSGNVALSTKMSSSIFLQPVAPQQKVVYVSARNTSTATGLNFRNELISALIDEGYRITNNPRKANFMLMSNVLYIGKESRSYTAIGALAGGFGGAFVGSRYNSGTGVVAGGALGALAGGIIGSMFQNKNYIMVVDIQLEQREAGTYTTSSTNAGQGTASNITTHNGGVKNWAIYRNRIVSQASAINLKFSSAEPLLKRQMAHSIANLMP